MDDSRMSERVKSLKWVFVLVHFRYAGAVAIALRGNESERERASEWTRVGWWWCLGSFGHWHHMMLVLLALYFVVMYDNLVRCFCSNRQRCHCRCRGDDEHQQTRNEKTSGPFELLCLCMWNVHFRVLVLLYWLKPHFSSVHNVSQVTSSKYNTKRMENNTRVGRLTILQFHN